VIFDDHESTVSAVKIFEERSSGGGRRRLKYITCSTDKMMVVRNSRYNITEEQA
jgi:hypothetical protein